MFKMWAVILKSESAVAIPHRREQPKGQQQQIFKTPGVDNWL